MAIRQEADVAGLDPNTGELLFEFRDVDDGKPEPTPEQKVEAQKNFDGGDPEKAQDRYKAVQGWATRVNQNNLDLQRELADLREQVGTRQSSTPSVTLPKTSSPENPDLDVLLQDPEAFKKFMVDTIHSEFGIIGEYVREQLKPFNPVLVAYNTHQELTTSLEKHDDFVQWHPEMLELAKNNTENLSLEQLYAEARKLNPEKAFAIDSGEYKPDEGNKEEVTTEPASTPESVETPGTEPQTPGTSEPSASSVPAIPGAIKTEDFRSGHTATASELQERANRLRVETGVGDGSHPEPTTPGIDGAMEGAWDEITSNAL